MVITAPNSAPADAWPGASIPEFRPHPLLTSGHSQTLAGWAPVGAAVHYTATQHMVALDDGDQIVLHEDRPAGWKTGDRSALLVHGLGGCHASPYMRRVAARLQGRGVRVFRMDMRGSGAGALLARHPMHSARTGDMAAALVRIGTLVGQSPVAMIGFSLGGNLVLNSAAATAVAEMATLCIAVCPPIDLLACTDHLQRGTGRLYDRYFVRLLLKRLRDQRRHDPGAADVRLNPRPRTLFAFDDAVTAPMCNFRGARHYYEQTSPGPRLDQIRIPTVIVAAADDPLVPAEPFRRYTFSDSTRLHLIPGGGHLGFVGRRGLDADRRWLDWRLVQWIAEDSWPT